MKKILKVFIFSHLFFTSFVQLQASLQEKTQSKNSTTPAYIHNLPYPWLAHPDYQILGGGKNILKKDSTNTHESRFVDKKIDIPQKYAQIMYAVRMPGYDTTGTRTGNWRVFVTDDELKYVAQITKVYAEHKGNTDVLNSLNLLYPVMYNTEFRLWTTEQKATIDDLPQNSLYQQPSQQLINNAKRLKTTHTHEDIVST